MATGADRGRYSIQVSEPDADSRTLEILITPFVVGRDHDCDLVLGDPVTSRRHFQLEVQSDGRIVLRDLESSNGTFLDGKRVEDGAWLPLPATVRAGRSTFVVSVTESRRGLDR